MVYNLTKDDLELAEQLAHHRGNLKRRTGVASNKYYPHRGDFETDLIGVQGEIAVIQLLPGSKLDGESDNPYAGDRGWDVVLHTGQTIEVKTTGKRGHRFALNTAKLKNFRANIGVLVWPTSHEGYLEVMGTIGRKRFALECQMTNFGYGPRLCVELSKMRPFEKLVAWQQTEIENTEGRLPDHA